MRFAPWLFVVLLAFLGAWAPAALAGGVDLTWGSGCYPETPQILRTFACNTNTGTASMIASFQPSVDAPAFVGIEATMRFQVQATFVPDWWQFWSSGTCRQSALSTSVDFLTAPQQVCADAWAGLGAGGITSYLTSTSLNPPATAFLRLAFAVANAVPLQRFVEYYGFRTTVTFAKTTGTGACTGCTTPVLISLDEIKTSQSDGTVEHDTTPISNACVSWQSGSGCQIVPVRNVTWGRIQSLYR